MTLVRYLTERLAIDERVCYILIPWLDAKTLVVYRVQAVKHAWYCGEVPSAKPSLREQDQLGCLYLHLLLWVRWE